MDPNLVRIILIRDNAINSFVSTGNLLFVNTGLIGAAAAGAGRNGAGVGASLGAQQIAQRYLLAFARGMETSADQAAVSIPDSLAAPTSQTRCRRRIVRGFETEHSLPFTTLMRYTLPPHTKVPRRCCACSLPSC